MTAHSWQANGQLANRELSSALARRSRIQAYRGRPAPFDLMAALPIEPAGLWGLVVLAAVSRRRFVPPCVRTASRPSTFSTTSKGTCSKCVWAFCLAPSVLTMEEQYQLRRATGHLLCDVDLSLSLLVTDSNSGTCTGLTALHSTRLVNVAVRYLQSSLRCDTIRHVSLTIACSKREAAWRLRARNSR